MSKKKTDLVEKLIQEVELRHPIPSKPMEGASLLEQGAVIVLMRHMTEPQAEATVRAIKAAYEDWNEVRVAQAQEIARCIRTSSRKKGVELLRDRRETAMALKDYLQDVFQHTHHLDLEELREDEQTAGKVASSLGVLGYPGAAYLVWLATDGQVPVHLPLVRLLDRLELIGRTTSLKKARTSIEPLVPKGNELQFILAFHEILERWDDEKEPIYLTVKALRETSFGSKTAKEREASIARAEAALKREEERIRKEEERERKKNEAEAKKRARDLERKRKAEEKKLAEARAKAAVAEEKKRAAAEKKADAKKEADAKKAEAKKAAAKEAAAKKAAAKKAAGKKPSTKTAAPKTSSAGGSAAGKSRPKKVATEAPTGASESVASDSAASTSGTTAAKKATTKKPASKKPAAKKATSKKPAAKKATSKKPAAKKKVTKKPTVRRR